MKVRPGEEYVTLVDFWTANQRGGIVWVGDFVIGYDPGVASVSSPAVVITCKGFDRPVRFYPHGAVPACATAILESI